MCTRADNIFWLDSFELLLNNSHNPQNRSYKHLASQQINKSYSTLVEFTIVQKQTKTLSDFTAKATSLSDCPRRSDQVDCCTHKIVRFLTANHHRSSMKQIPMKHSITCFQMPTQPNRATWIWWLYITFRWVNKSNILSAVSRHLNLMSLYNLSAE